MPSTPKKVMDGTEYLSGSGGRLIDRYYIEDIPPGPDMHIRATLVGGLPIENQPHPYKPLYLLRNKRGIAISHDQAFVDCFYVQLAATITGGGTGPQYRVRNSTIIQMRMTERAATSPNGEFGQTVTVHYKSNLADESVDIVDTRKVTPTPQYIGHRVLIAEATRQLLPVPEEIHDLVSRGSVNATPWRGQAARTWMIASAADEGEVVNGVPLYNHSIEFWHNFEGWDQYVFYRDPQGNIPKDAIIGQLPQPPAGKILWQNGSSLVNTQWPVNFDQYIDLD